MASGIGANAQTVLLSPTGDGGFENTTSTFSANGWTEVQPGNARQWRVGTTAGAQGGTKAAYVGAASNYNGTANASVQHFYRDIAIPAGATNVSLTYYYKQPTVDNTFDYFYIFTTTTANTPVSGTTPGTGYTQRFVNTATTYANFTAASAIDLTALAGTTVRLVFTFRSDGASPHANPAIDNISLTYNPGTTPHLSTGALTAFGNQCINQTSTANSFTVTGGNLTGDVTIGALSGYTYSATSGGTYTSTLTLTPTSGSLAGVPVYVKFTPTTTTSYAGNIPVSGGGATATSVAASGTGVNTTPTVTAGTATTTLTGATISGSAISALGCSAVTAYGIEYSTTVNFAGGTGTQVAGTGFSGSAGGTFSAAITGLTQATIYYYRAYATNSGGTTYSTVSAFTTQYSTGVTWTETFGVTSVPMGWSNNSSWNIGNNTALGTTTGNYIYKNLYNLSTSANFTTINVGLLGSNDRLYLEYKLANFSSPYAPPAAASGNFVVEISTNYGSTWTTLETVANNAVEGWQIKTYPLAAYSGQYVKLRITGNRTSGDYYLAFDNFKIEPTPSCETPVAAFTSSAITTTTATLTWGASASAPAGGYEYYYTTTSDNPNVTNPTASGTTTAGTITTGISGLTAFTTYNWWVRAVCDTNNKSLWMSGGSFTTAKLEPTNYATNFAVGTATTANIPLTWTAATGTVTPDGYLLKANSSATITDPADATDPGAGSLSLATLQASYKATGAATATATFTGGTAGTMYHFKNYTYTNSGTNINFKTDAAVPYIYYATKPNPVTGASGTINGSTAAAISWTLPSGYSTGNHAVLVFVKAASAVTAGTPTNAPSVYTAGTVFGTGTAYQGDAAAYCVYNGDGTSVNITGLTASTTYHVSIVVVMEAANYNNTHSYSSAATTSFYTGYCIPTSTSSEYWITNFSTTGGASNINNTSAFTTGSYANNSAMSASIAQGASINFSVSTNTSTHGINIWVDYNDDFTFADSEKVYASGTYVSSAASSFTIPANAVVGSHRMRVRISFTPVDPTACGSHSGETEDYTLNVLQACSASITSVAGAERCGAGTVTLTAVGVNAVEYRWYDSAQGGTLLHSSASASWSPSITATTTYYTAAYNGTCESDTRKAVTATVNPAPAVITLTPNGASVCTGEVQQLTATGGNTTSSVALKEDFNSGAPTWTRTNNSTGGTPENAAWTIYLSDANFHSNDSSDFILSDSDGQGSGGTTATLLVSPSFNLANFSSATLKFYHYYEDMDSDAARVQIKVGDGSWTNIKVYNDNDVSVGTETNFALETIDLTAYVGNADVKIRFKYDATYGYYWAIDNVVVSGTELPQFTWQASQSNVLFTDAAGTVAYTGDKRASVYVKTNTATDVTAATTNLGGCSNSKTVSVTIKDKEWTGAVSADWNTAGNWCGNTVPSAIDNVVIPATATVMPVVSSAGATAASLSIASGKTVTVNSNNFITVTNAVTGAGTLLLQNNAHLMQDAGATANTNTAAIQLYRNSSPLLRQDYTFWSSPTSGQGLFQFSPNTLANRFYTYNTVTDQFNSVSGLSSESNITFEAAAGYLIRLPNGAFAADNTTLTGTINGTPAQYQQGAATMVYNGKFTGVPNNGNIGYSASLAANGYNLIGNPYPSPISIAAFFAGNAGNTDGTIYIWRKTNSETTASAYCTINSAGDYVGNLQPGAENPNGIIQTGQGFIVRALNSTINFTNAMRSSSTGNDLSFFRNQNDPQITENHRIWLNLHKGNAPVAQMMVGYKSNATMSVDAGIDSPFINDVATGLNSNIGGQAFAIQGRSLPFSNQDVVPLQFKTNAAGSYTITIDHVDGLFLQGQDVFIKDNLLNVTHKVSESAYAFTTEAGTFNDRFEVVYINSTLANENPVLDPNTIVVYKQDNNLHINTGNATMADVRLFDIRGRLVYEKKDVNAATLIINSLKAEEQMLVVQVTTADGAKASKKIIY